jgi:undecaprenyl-diphosphatase
VNTVLAYVNDSDLRVAFRLNGWAPPAWFRTWMMLAKRLGDGWLWAAGGLLFLAGGPSRPRNLLAAALAAALANAAIVLLKRRFRRARPSESGPHPAFGVGRPECFAFDEFSFPSGHTLNAFTVATLVALQFPLLAPVVVVAASSVGVSRIVMGLHYLSDVLVGAILGTTIGSGAYFALLS